MKKETTKTTTKTVFGKIPEKTTTMGEQVKKKIQRLRKAALEYTTETRKNVLFYPSQLQYEERKRENTQPEEIFA